MSVPGRALVAAGLLCTMCAGCTALHRNVVEAFPPGGAASPWQLQDAVWSGSFDEAAAALGPDADAWRVHGPTRVWLAVYRHEEEPARTVTVRAFAFASADAARRAYDAFRPLDAKAYEIGDAGCWTEVGLLFQWRRLVFDVFGHDASWGSTVQASFVAALIAKRMPPGVPENPQ